MGKLLSANLDTKRLSATILPVRVCVSFKVQGEEICCIAFTFSGLTSMPLSVTIYPKIFPASTQNVQFAGFSLMSCFRTVVSVSSTSDTCNLALLILTSISSTYASIFLQLLLTHLIYHSLVDRSCIFQSERHYRIISTWWSDKGTVCPQDAIISDGNLVKHPSCITVRILRSNQQADR